MSNGQPSPSIVPTAVPPTALRCPYPRCDGELPLEPGGDALCHCPRCYRASARCSQLSGQCRALNRPLASFCRQCREPLLPGWARAAWERDLLSSGRRSRMAVPQADVPVLDVGPPEGVLDLGQALAPDPWSAWPIVLGEAAGRIWVGAADGRCLFVAPFSRPEDSLPPGVRVWTGEAHGLQASASGPWMLFSCDRGLKALNLLALDDPDRTDLGLIPLGETARTRLASNAVLLRGHGEGLAGLARTAVWLTREPDSAEPTLCRAVLSPELKRGSTPQMVRCSLGAGTGSGERPSLANDRDRAVLLEVPFGSPGRLLLALRRGLWLIHVPTEAGQGEVRLQRLFTGATLQTHLGSMPCLAFEPAGIGDAGGRVFFTTTADGQRALNSLSLTATGAPASTPFPDYDGVPLAPVERTSRRGILCLQREELAIRGSVGNHIPVAAGAVLGSVQSVTVSGRLAVCIGQNVVGNRHEWRLIVTDLERCDLVSTHPSSFPIGGPLLLGRYLFTAEGDDQNLHLVRREIRPRKEVSVD
jgi:hypothetical protein